MQPGISFSQFFVKDVVPIMDTLPNHFGLLSGGPASARPNIVTMFFTHSAHHFPIRQRVLDFIVAFARYSLGMFTWGHLGKVNWLWFWRIWSNGCPDAAMRGNCCVLVM